jgi:hypothetical protein
MDKVAMYRRILRLLVNKYARYVPSHGQIEAIAVSDAKTDNYLVIHTGWDNVRRVYATILHLRLRDGKVLIEEDGLDEGVTQELLDAGISQKDIVYSSEQGATAFKKAS